MSAVLEILLYAVPLILFEIIYIIKIGQPVTLPRGIGLFLFSLSIIAILVITGVTPARGVRGEIDLEKANFIPLHGIMDMFRNNKWVFLRNVAGNLSIFIPIGFLIPLLWARCGWWRTLLLGFSFSFAIETLQLFFLRNTDVDDLLLNTLGTYVGYLLFCLFKYFAPRLTQRVTTGTGGVPKPALRMLLGIFSVLVIGCFK